MGPWPASPNPSARTCPLDEVRTKIEAALRPCAGRTEVQSGTVQARMLEVEQAQMTSEARPRLGQIRVQLGLEAGDNAEAAAIPGRSRRRRRGSRSTSGVTPQLVARAPTASAICEPQPAFCTSAVA